MALPIAPPPAKLRGMGPAAIPRSAMILSLALVAAASGVGTAAGQPDGLPPAPYFPAAFRQSSVACEGGGSPAWRREILGATEAEWYPKHLRAAREPSLYLASLNAPTSRSYRFAWFRTFHAPVLVRLDEAPGGELRLTATRLSGEGGYDPGRIADRQERTLTPTEAATFRALLRDTRVFAMPAVACALGLDGASWILEANEAGAYRYINRHTPKSGPVRDTGLAMLALTGWTFDPIY